MKTLFALLVSASFIMGCLASVSDEIQEYIPGTYVRASDGEFGKSWDTLIITLQNKEASQYKITRRWRYDRVLDGRPIKPEYKIRETSAIYSAANKTLQDSKTLVLFTFDVKKKLLFEGVNQFFKIK